uniref:MutT/nudix family protein putative n=1 Tax=Albugo laibachii Nc14 TaxID=890382 RepID=F0WQ22_9STRA|nr:mutT/nudix family protein putative [Albugo laibachii Nc14]|eukprot:CCA23427.1 mutT/nudix family protein putative [Albugo laibachii Nc14]
MERLASQNLLSNLQRNLSLWREVQVVRDTLSKASVAAILRWKERKSDTLQLLFIRRADNEGDAWSGQIAFPGGRRQIKRSAEALKTNHSEDWETSRETATRETFEEVGLKLDEPNVHWIGQFQPIRTHLRSLYVTTEVFFVDEPAEDRNTVFTVQPKEVADVFWVEVKELYNSDRYHHLIWPMKTYFEKSVGFPFLGRLLHRIIGDMIVPCIYLPRPCSKVQSKDDCSITRHQSDYVLWGLTLTAVLKIFEAADSPLSFPASPFQFTSRCGASLLSLHRLCRRPSVFLAIAVSAGFFGVQAFLSRVFF